MKTPCGLDIMFTEKMTRERNEAIKKKPCCVFISNEKRSGKKRAREEAERKRRMEEWQRQRPWQW